MALPIIDVTMRFKPPSKEPEILVDGGCRHIIYATPEDAFPAVIATSYRRNPDGTVDVTGDYNPQDLVAQMRGMGYEVATQGLGRVIEGYNGVIGFSSPVYCSPFAVGRILRQLNREVSLRGQSSL